MQLKPSEVNEAFCKCFKEDDDDDDEVDVNFYCQARRMKILQKVVPYIESVKIVGIASSQGCSKDAIFQTTLEHTNSVTETSAFVTKKSSKFDYGALLSVELPKTSTGLGDSTEIISVDLDSNTPNDWNWASSKIRDTSSSSTAQSLRYKGTTTLQKIYSTITFLASLFKNIRFNYAIKVRSLFIFGLEKDGEFLQCLEEEKLPSLPALLKTY